MIIRYAPNSYRQLRFETLTYGGWVEAKGSRYGLAIEDEV